MSTFKLQTPKFGLESVLINEINNSTVLWCLVAVKLQLEVVVVSLGCQLLSVTGQTKTIESK